MPYHSNTPGEKRFGCYWSGIDTRVETGFELVPTVLGYSRSPVDVSCRKTGGGLLHSSRPGKGVGAGKHGQPGWS